MFWVLRFDETGQDEKELILIRGQFCVGSFVSAMLLHCIDELPLSEFGTHVVQAKGIVEPRTIKGLLCFVLEVFFYLFSEIWQHFEVWSDNV